VIGMTAQRLHVIAEMVQTSAAMAEFMLAVPPSEAGALVAFSGVVRDHDGGRRVDALEYEAHPSAEDVLRENAREIAERHPEVSTIRVAHRSGLLQIGDCALYAAISAPHRGEAFAACSELVDLIKATLPVWKRQAFADGTDEWVNSP
jgi:molybdopterin synthase catalytic subunit